MGKGYLSTSWRIDSNSAGECGMWANNSGGGKGKNGDPLGGGVLGAQGTAHSNYCLICLEPLLLIPGRGRVEIKDETKRTKKVF